MHGTVWEWVEGHWHGSYEGAADDGAAWVDEGAEVRAPRVLRGGSWDLDQDFARSARRFRVTPKGLSNNLDFRVVCSPPSSGH